MRATMFVISRATDRPNLYYASWERIEKAARSGRWDIEAHTHDGHHEQEVDGGEKLPALTSLQPGESITGYRDRIARDLDRNNEAIEDHVGHEPVAFAYPYGAYGGDRTNDPQIRDVLRDEIAARYTVAFQQDGQDSVPLLDAGQNRAELRRLEVGDWSGADLLSRIRRAAGDNPPPATTAPVPADDADRLTELVAPPLEGRANRPGRTTIPTSARAVRLTTPGAPEVVPATVGGPAVTTKPGAEIPEPEAPTTTTAPPPSSTTTSTTTPSTTTTATTQPPTTTTTRPSTTTTTRPSSETSTTTTTDKPCHGREKGGKPCRR
jgi:peptidoglycan/xylan/chitin deacetylase (PgdA/CDA1 family)